MSVSGELRCPGEGGAWCARKCSLCPGQSRLPPSAQSSPAPLLPLLMTGTLILGTDTIPVSEIRFARAASKAAEAHPEDATLTLSWIVVRTDGRVYRAAAPTVEERRRWLKGLAEARQTELFASSRMSISLQTLLNLLHSPEYKRVRFRTTENTIESKQVACAWVGDFDSFCFVLFCFVFRWMLHLRRGTEGVSRLNLWPSQNRMASPWSQRSDTSRCLPR